MKPRVLIVDDSLTVRMDLADTFRAAGFEVLLASDASSARSQLALEKIDVLILDVLLPDGDGVDILREVRESEGGSKLVILMLSNEADVEDRIRGLRTGADEYVGKPYDVAHVLGRARELVAHRKSLAPPVAVGAPPILLIEDSPTFREYLAAALREHGHDVTIASSGEEGLRLATLRRPAAILVDGVLPGIDGATVIRRVRLDAALRGVPCILLTAARETEAELRALDSGADAFVRKDEDAALILAKLGALLRSAGDAAASPQAISALGHKKILAVDDSPTYRAQLSQELETEGYEIILARSGEEAIELLSVQSVDCVLLDLIMEGIGGTETCRLIKNSPTLRDLPVIVLTSVEDRATMLDAMAIGADDYIPKSAEFAVLKARVRAQLRRRQFEDETRRMREQLLRSEIEAAAARAARELAETRARLVQALERKNEELETAYRELQTAQSQLVQSAKMASLGELVAGVAHEINNPLAFVLSHLDTTRRSLSKAVPDPETMTQPAKEHWSRAQSRLDEMNLGLQRIQELVVKLRTFSRLDEGEQKVVSIRECIESILTILGHKLKDRIRVTTHFGEPDHIECLPGLLTQAILNLVANSVDAIESEGHIEIRTGAVGENYQIVITDTGHGIPPHLRERVMEPFFTTKPVGHGTGLGLSIAYSIVRKHGGTLALGDAAGGGTQALIILPLQPSGGNEAMQVEPGTKQRVLLVDDEPQVLIALEDLLSDDFEIFKTTSPHGALELLDREPDIAVVVTDQRMPRMTGEEFLATLPEQSSTRRIMITGYADVQALIRAVNSGRLFAYVTKPWNARELHETVAKAAEQFRLSQRLTTDRQLLHDLLENSPDGIFFKDRERRFVEVNRAFLRMFSLGDRSQLLGKRIDDVVGDARLLDDVQREELSVLTRGSAALDTIRSYARDDDSAPWLAETRAPVRAPDGDTVGLVGVTRDVTDRVLAQRALIESEALLQKQTTLLNSILKGLAEGVVVTDQQGNFLLCNPEAERILGLNANALTVSDWVKLCELHEADDKTPITSETDPIARAMAGAELTEIEMCVRTNGSPPARIWVSATPLRSESGVPIGGIGLLRDLTGQREMEQRLSQAQKTDAIGRLAGGVAHDFNNLLSVIQSCGELLLRSLPAADPKRVEVGYILNAAQRAALLTHRLLSFSRHTVVQPKALQINEVVRSIEPMLRRVICEHTDVVTRLAGDTGLITMDASQLEQVILNLALNARDAMPSGGVLRIETMNLSNRDGEDPRWPAGDFVVLAIRDTGSGMVEETQRKMYEPFFTTKDLGKGSGLGLSTVYGIVEQNGGQIRCRTAPEQGTSFEICFARTYASAPKVAPPAPRIELSSGGNSTILLVEDEDSVRRVAAAILRNHGYTVLEARRPSDAIRICTTGDQRIDLLLTDVVMPESSGPQLAAEVTLRQPGISVMYMSGYSGDNALMGKALRDGITFLQKPFTPALLTEAVSEALENFGTRRSVLPKTLST